MTSTETSASTSARYVYIGPLCDAHGRYIGAMWTDRDPDYGSTFVVPPGISVEECGERKRDEFRKGARNGV